MFYQLIFRIGSALTIINGIASILQRILTLQPLRSKSVCLKIHTLVQLPSTMHCSPRYWDGLVLQAIAPHAIPTNNNRETRKLISSNILTNSLNQENGNSTTNDNCPTQGGVSNNWFRLCCRVVYRTLWELSLLQFLISNIILNVLCTWDLFSKSSSCYYTVCCVKSQQPGVLLYTLSNTKNDCDVTEGT